MFYNRVMAGQRRFGLETGVVAKTEGLCLTPPITFWRKFILPGIHP
jgi:hypothetical protein